MRSEGVASGESVEAFYGKGSRFSGLSVKGSGVWFYGLSFGGDRGRGIVLLTVGVYCPALNSFTAREKIDPKIERRFRQNSNGMPLKFLACKKL